MGEIKSTLDLVLEKTKNLTLSSEEKEEQKQKEIGSHIKGMLQKFQDGILTKSRLKTDYEILKKDFSLPHNNMLINEIIGRIELHGNNQFLLELIPECCGIDSAAFKSVIEDFRKAHFTAEENRAERLKELLAQQHGVSGSAMVPNLDKDEQWRRESREMRAGFEDQIKRVAAELIVDCPD